MNIKVSHGGWVRLLWGVFFLLVLAAISQATFKTFAFWYGPQLEMFYQITHVPDWKGGNLWSIALHLLDGTARPDFPMYTWANRQLSPRLILGITSFGLNFREATILFMWSGIFVINILMGVLLFKSGHSYLKSLSLVTVFNYLFLVYQDRSGNGFFYTWDIISLICFTVFPFLALRRMKVVWLIGLFLICLFNREDVVFIALYIILSGLSIGFWRPSIRISDIKSVVLGATLLVVCVAYTDFARKYFAATRDDHIGAALGNSVTPLRDGFYNLFIRNFSFENDKFFFNAIDGFWIIASTIGLVAIYNQMAKPGKDLILTYIAFILSIIIFGNHASNEIRLYLPLFPMFVFLMAEVDFGGDGISMRSTSRERNGAV